MRVELIEMGYAVEERKDDRIGADGRFDSRDRAIEVVGLAGEQHKIPVAVAHLGHELRVHGEAAVLALDHDAAARDLSGASRTHQERDLRTRFDQAGAEIAADATGT